jgi:hypothetical protein
VIICIGKGTTSYLALPNSPPARALGPKVVIGSRCLHPSGFLLVPGHAHAARPRPLANCVRGRSSPTTFPTRQLSLGLDCHAQSSFDLRVTGRLLASKLPGCGDSATAMLKGSGLFDWGRGEAGRRGSREYGGW